MRKQILFILSTSLAFWLSHSSLAHADVLHNDDVYIEGHLCLSDDDYCVDPETYTSGTYLFNADLKIKDDYPGLYFNDISTSANDWFLGIDYSVTIAPVPDQSFAIFNGLDPDGTTGDFVASMVVEANGPHNQLYLDSLGFIGFNTNTPSNDLEIASTSPTIALFDTDGPRMWEINSNTESSYFDIRDVTAGTSPFVIRSSTPNNTLYMNSAGNVGIGTASPNSKLNVVAGNDALIRVDNTTVSPPAGDQAMFRLQSAAPNKVRFVMGNSNGLWTFDNAGTSFQINKAGTGVNEFRVEDDGDLHALGSSYALNHVNTSSRESKTDFAPIDEIVILEKLSELPMSTWRYKQETADERHLGPIAEDFQLAFGLSDGKHISTVDASGVALTAIKGLNKVLQKRSAEIVELTQANRDLQKANSDLISANEALDERLTRLENVLFHQNEVAVR